MKIYQIDSSARKKGSTSRALAKKLLDKIKKPEDEVIYRDLDDEMLFVSGLTESGMNIDEKDQTEEHKKMFELSDKLVKELKDSDIIIISAPIYNYGPPATLKAWSDLAARIGETFRFKPNGRREGLLKNKRAYLVITSGGTKLNSSEDFLTPWLKFILNFFGIEKVDIISADQMALDYEKSIKEAEKQKAPAVDAKTTAGKVISKMSEHPEAVESSSFVNATACSAGGVSDEERDIKTNLTENVSRKKKKDSEKKKCNTAKQGEVVSIGVTKAVNYEEIAQVEKEIDYD